MAVTTSDSELSESSIHEVLSNDRRRMVIRLLQENDALTLKELSERIAESETGESPAPRNIRQSAYVSLQQTHIPKLTSLGVVDYDERDKTVELNRRSKVTVYMEVVPEGEIAWSEYYAGVSLLGLTTMAAVAAGVPAFESVGGLALATVGFAIVFVSAVCQRWCQVAQ
jgi:hypothetical protein